MGFFTRIILNDDMAKQLSGDSLMLYGETDFQGILKSKGIEIDASLTGGVLDGWVLTLDGGKIILKPSASSGTTSFYDGASPSTITVGGIPANTDLITGNAGSGFTSFDLWEKLLVVYQVPAFNVFNNSIPSLSEVGNPSSWTGVQGFSWTTTNSGNVQPNTIEVIDVTNGNSILGSGLANDGSEPLNINTTIINNVPIQHTWGVKGTNTETDPIGQKNYTINTINPWFYGTYASGGAPSGANRPNPLNSVVAQGLIDSGVVIVSNSSGTVIVNNFAASPDDYIWFAIPSSSTSKLKWYVNALDNGSIGGTISPAGNLFPSPALVGVDSPSAYWNGVQYKIYLSNKQVNSTYMEFRNS